MANVFCCQQNSVSRLENLIKELVVDKELRRWAARERERERDRVKKAQN
jgi:hypothetical protein